MNRWVSVFDGFAALKEIRGPTQSAHNPKKPQPNVLIGKCIKHTDKVKLAAPPEAPQTICEAVLSYSTGGARKSEREKTMPELVKIPLASAEYYAQLERPHVGMLGIEGVKIVDAVFNALSPFNLKLANVDVVTTGPLSDRKVTFKIPEGGLLFKIGPEDYTFTKEGSSWQTVEQDAMALVAAERAFLEATGAKVKSCQVGIAMHLQPLGKTRDELLAPFVPEPFKSLLSNTQAKSFGNHLRWTDGDVLIDFSLAIANGIFVRMSSQFDGHPQLTEVLKKVRTDEEALFRILGVEEDMTSA